MHELAVTEYVYNIVKKQIGTSHRLSVRLNKGIARNPNRDGTLPECLMPIEVP